MKGIYAKINDSEEQKINLLKATWKLPRKDETLRRMIREFPVEKYVQLPQQENGVNEPSEKEEDENEILEEDNETDESSVGDRIDFLRRKKP